MAGLRLDRRKHNWVEWSKRILLVADSNGLTEWLDGTLKLPDQETYPEAHRIWEINDRELRAFIFRNISKDDYHAVSHLQESHAVFEELRKRHDLSLAEQLILFNKALDIRFSVNTPLSETIDEIMTIHEQLADKGIMPPDLLLCFFLYNALDCQPEFHHINIAIMEAGDSPDFSSSTILRLLEREALLQRLRSATSGAAKGGRATNAKCSICKSADHTENSCIQSGGEMAGQSLDKALVDQRAASGKRPPRRRRRRRNRSSQPATGTPSTSAATTSAQQIQTVAHPIEINGLLYYPVPNAVAPPQYQ
jgi:hypothetical protein